MKHYINPEIQYICMNTADLLTVSTETGYENVVCGESFGQKGIIGGSNDIIFGE